MNHMVGDILSGVNRGLIVHGCNAAGVMGGGIALQIKQQFPAAYKAYKVGLDSCLMMKSQPLGKIFVANIAKDLFIVNAITQAQYGTGHRQVDYEAVAQCFEQLSTSGLPIHYPMIGAGLGGGNWTIISTIINETLIGCDHTLWTLK